MQLNNICALIENHSLPELDLSRLQRIRRSSIDNGSYQSIEEDRINQSRLSVSKSRLIILLAIYFLPNFNFDSSNELILHGTKYEGLTIWFNHWVYSVQDVRD